MTACPECGTDLPAEADFCRNCGTSVGTTCRNCGTSAAPGATFCPSCGEALRGEEPTSSGGTLRLRPQEFARRVSGGDLKAGGLLNRLQQKEQVQIEAGNRALFLENGKLQATLGPGKHTLDSLGQKILQLRRSQDYVAVLVEDGDTVVSIALDDIRTASDYPIGVTIELVVGIDDAWQFFTSLMADRDRVTVDTFERLLGDAIRDELEATIGQYEPDDLYGNREVKRDLRAAIERECAATFERNGLELVDLRSFDYEDDKGEVRQQRKTVEIRREKEALRDEEADLDRHARERAAEDTVHEQQQRVREETAEQAADHEVETQAIEHDHEKDDMQRRHRHTAEREEVEHAEEKKTTRKEGEVERRDLEHEQDVEEIEDLMDLKEKKDQQKLDREEREQDIEMQREEHEVEVEKERLEARDEVDLDTLASMEDVDEAVAELAEIEKAADLTPEQLEALGAQDSDELAKARQEAHKADAERARVEDQKEFREEMRDVVDDSMDRMQDTTESAMDNMGETGRAAAEDTSDNVIVSDAGSSDDGDTTIVQGGPGGSGSGDGGSGGDGSDGPERVRVCPGCESEVPAGDDFCTNCGTEL